MDGAVFSACPGTVAGSFDPDRHEFRNFDAAEATADLLEFTWLLRSINPGVRIILTVSPVPLIATATGDHVLTASIYSKSVLRVAAAELARLEPEIAYFPAYEIVTGHRRRTGFSRQIAGTSARLTSKAWWLRSWPAARRPVSPPQRAGAMPSPDTAAMRLSQLVSDTECEEAAAGIAGAAFRGRRDRVLSPAARRSLSG